MPPATLLPTLHDSAREGNLEGVQALLRTGVDVNLVDNKYGKTPLCWATEYGQWEVAKLLLNRGADFNLADSIGRKPLLCAARHGYKSIAQLLLDRGDTVTSKDKNGRNALSLAAKEGYTDVVRLLISFGDDVNSNDIVNQTPLSLATKNGHLEIVLLLLDKGADPNSMESSNNRSPLLFAAMTGYVDIVRLLVARNAKIDSKDSDGRTPLSWAAANGDDEMVQFLLAKGADVNSKDNYNRTPLSHASEFGHTAAAKTLLKENGVEYDVQDTYYDQTPLSWAAEGGYDEIVGMLLDKEVEVDSQDRAGHTPLLWAIRNSHDAVVELLLKKDVDVIMKNEDDWSPLSWAAHLGDEPLTRRLLSKAVELNSKIGTAIAEAIESTLWRANGSLLDAKNSLEQAKRDPSLSNDPFFGSSETEIKNAQEELARAKANLEAKHATVLKHEAVVNLIIERDEYLNIKDYKERTLLSWAAENGHDDILELLLSRELNPDSTDQLYRTPISWAAREGHESTLIILIDRNVNPDWRDGAGRTPLSLAAEKGHQDVVKLLLNFDAFLATRAYALPLDVKKKPVGLYTIPQDSSDNLDPDETGYYDFERGVDIDSRDNSGQTPLEFAVKEGHGKVVDLLLDKGANMDTNRADNKSLWQLIDDELNAPETDKLKAANLIDVRILLEKRLEYGLLLTDPIEKIAPVDRKFKATIVYFLTKGEGVRERSTFQRYNIYDLMKGKNLNDLIATRETTCKWLHVPVNNVSLPKDV
jgi:ankyrin repeat protein